MKASGKMIRWKDMDNFIMETEAWHTKDFGKMDVSMAMDKFSMIGHSNLHSPSIIKISLRSETSGFVMGIYIFATQSQQNTLIPLSHGPTMNPTTSARRWG